MTLHFLCLFFPMEATLSGTARLWVDTVPLEWVQERSALAATCRACARLVWESSIRHLLSRSIRVLCASGYPLCRRGKAFYADVGWTLALARHWMRWREASLPPIIPSREGRVAPGTWVRAPDGCGVIHKAVVLALREDGHDAFVRYAGWTSAWNQWVPIAQMTPLSARARDEGYLLWKARDDTAFQIVWATAVWVGVETARDTRLLQLRVARDERMHYVKLRRHEALLQLDDLTALICLTKALQGAPYLAADLPRHIAGYVLRTTQMMALCAGAHPPMQDRSFGGKMPPVPSSALAWPAFRAPQAPACAAPVHLCFTPFAYETLWGYLETDDHVQLGRTCRTAIDAACEAWLLAGRTRLLHKLPPNPVSGRMYDAQRLGIRAVQQLVQWRALFSTPRPAHRRPDGATYRRGDVYDVCDLLDIWHPATIVDVAADGAPTVHFDGWAAGMNETIPRHACARRIAPAGTRAYVLGGPLREKTYCLIPYAGHPWLSRIVHPRARYIYAKVVAMYAHADRTFVVLCDMYGHTRRTWQRRARGTLLPMTDETVVWSGKYLTPRSGLAALAQRESGVMPRFF